MSGIAANLKLDARHLGEVRFRQTWVHAQRHLRNRGRIFIGPATSDRKLKASREGSKRRICGCKAYKAGEASGGALS